MIRDLEDDRWRKASASGTQGGSECVEVHPAGAVRDSKAPGAGHLTVPLADLLTAVKADHLIR